MLNYLKYIKCCPKLVQEKSEAMKSEMKQLVGKRGTFHSQATEE